jgi:hypothetical protein
MSSSAERTVASLMARMKRVLRPLRPILLPVWRRIRPHLETSTAWQPWTPPAGPITGPVRPLTQGEFDALVRDHPYYRTRGRYMSAAARLAGELIVAHGATSALELGPHLQPIVVGADAMELRENPGLHLEPGRRVIVHDATQTPWPVADRQYDLFVGLQVFEHLGTLQNAAFHEVARVARNAIISLPIEWEMENTNDCHHGITRERALSWFQPWRPTRIVVGNPGRRTRLIYVFENLDATSSEAEGDGQAAPSAASDLA